MKMSKVFELPVTIDSDGDIVLGDCQYLIRSLDAYKEQAQVAAHCINTHDKLIDLLKQAVGRVVISAADQDELQWLIDAMEVLEGEL